MQFLLIYWVDFKFSLFHNSRELLKQTVLDMYVTVNSTYFVYFAIQYWYTVSSQRNCIKRKLKNEIYILIAKNQINKIKISVLSYSKQLLIECAAFLTYGVWLFSYYFFKMAVSLFEKKFKVWKLYFFLFME